VCVKLPNKELFHTWRRLEQFNPLNAELNTICNLLELLGAHHILHISGVRVNVPPVGMSALNKAHRRLNLFEVTSRNRTELEVCSPVDYWCHKSAFILRWRLNSCYCILRGVYEELHYAFYCPLVLDNLQVWWFWKSVNKISFVRYIVILSMIVT